MEDFTRKVFRHIYFTDRGTMRTGPALSWGDVERGGHEGADRRFRFRLNQSDTLNHCILFDFDNWPDDGGPALLGAAKEVLKGHACAEVHTGRGRHLYLPLVDGLEKGDYGAFKASYKGVMDAFMESAPKGVKADMHPFGFHASGRLPGSVNSKSGSEVVWLGSNKGPVCPSLDEVLDRGEAPPMVDRRVELEPGHWRPDLYCPFVRKVMENPSLGDENYQAWLYAAGALARAGMKDKMRKLAAATQKRTGNVGGFETGKYDYKCETVRGDAKAQEVTGNPCSGCRHGATGGSPAWVSGPEPTPAARTGFHLWRSTKEGPVLDRKRIHSPSVLAHWSNIHREKRMAVGEWLYVWDGSGFVKKGSLKVDSPGFPKDLLGELKRIPIGEIYTPSDMGTLKRALHSEHTLPSLKLEECDSERYMNLANGVYDLKENKLYAHHPKYRMLGTMETAYREDAPRPEFFHSFLDESVPEKDDQRLLRMFFGLAVSNIPVSETEMFLWLSGVSGGGKTSVTRILGELLGKDRLHYEQQGGMEFKEGGLMFSTAGRSCVVVEDIKMDDSAVQRNLERFITQYTTETVNVRLLYASPMVETPKGVLMFTSNDSPQFRSSNDGGFRRCRQIDFHASPSNPLSVTDFMGKIRAERDGILLWALEGLADYRENGPPEYTRGEAVGRTMIKDQVLDSLEVWSGMLEYDPDASVMSSVLYRMFLNNTGNNEKSYSKREFINGLRKYAPPLLGMSFADVMDEEGNWKVKVKKG